MDEEKRETEDQKELDAQKEQHPGRGNPPRRPARPPAQSARLIPPLTQTQSTQVVEYVVIQPAAECLPLEPLDVPVPEFLHDVERIEAVAALASLYHLGYVMHVFTALDRALAQFKSGQLRVAECRDELALHHLRRHGLVVSRTECATLVARHLGVKDPALPAGAHVDDVAPKLWRRLLSELGHGGPMHWARARAIADALAAHWTRTVSDDTVMTVRDLRLQYDGATRILADLADAADYWESVETFVGGGGGLLPQWRAHAATQAVFGLVVDTARGQYAGEALFDEGAPGELVSAAVVLSPEFASLLSAI